MAQISLPPGFQFHPTDAELIMYYLKRKVMGKKNHVIAVVNIYKFSPWDLPDKSCLRSKDLEWFFFCPREKYVSGGRGKRATENGYWKTTGKDRTVGYNGKTVGKVKTLVFHLGHAPQEQITDWVMHEYMILDDKLAASGDQDTYVLCKLFKKNCPGLKNGAQYGEPSKGVDCADVDDTQNHERSSIPNDQSLNPVLQNSLPKGLFDPGSTSGPSMIKEGPNVKQVSVLSRLCHPGITPCFSEDLSPCAGSSTRDCESADDFSRLLAAFTDDNHKDDDVYNGLKYLDNNLVEMNETRLHFSRMQNNFPPNEILLEDNLSYIELNDLLVPLDCSAEVNRTEVHRTDQLCDDIVCPYGQNMCSDDFNKEDGSSDVLKKINNQFNQRSNVAPHGLEHTLLPHNEHKGEHHFIQGMKRGESSSIPAAEYLLSFFTCDCSSIHIKAEVTYGDGEGTKEALSVMMEESSTYWCNCNNMPYLVDVGCQQFIEILLLQDISMRYFYHSSNGSLCFYHVRV